MCMPTLLDLDVPSAGVVIGVMLAGLGSYALTWQRSQRAWLSQAPASRPASSPSPFRASPEPPPPTLVPHPIRGRARDAAVHLLVFAMVAALVGACALVNGAAVLGAAALGAAASSGYASLALVRASPSLYRVTGLVRACLQVAVCLSALAALGLLLLAAAAPVLLIFVAAPAALTVLLTTTASRLVEAEALLSASRHLRYRGVTTSS